MTTEAKEKAESYLGKEFVITREFNAPRELVFAAWTDPRHVAQWWGPRGFTNPVCDWNAVAGQAIHVVMRGPNGVDYPMGGEFREIVPPEKLVFTTSALDDNGKPQFEFLHTMTLDESAAGRTKLTIKSRVTKITVEKSKHMIGGFEAGMTQSLVCLGELLEQGVVAASASATADRELVISREFDAPREMVWEAWTDPKQVVKWWGPRGFTTTIEEMNVRPGGIWKHVMRGPDGADYPNKSIFTEVVKPERIVYTHGGSKVGGPGVQFVATWSFDVVAENKTRLTIRQVFPTAEMREMVVNVYGAIEGAKQTLARLAEHLVAGPVVVERVFAAPVELVWRALTNAADIREWSFPVTDFKAEPGFTYQFVAGKEGGVQFNHLCEVKEAVPNRRLAYSWKYEGYPGESLVTIELEPEGGKTRLKLTHTGLESFQPETNPQLARGNFFRGWTKLIGTELKEHVESREQK